jgi:hypothetical protein
MVTLTWFIIGLEKDGERHIQMYVMITLTWFSGLKKGGERHIQMYVMIILTWFIIGLKKRWKETHTNVWHDYPYLVYYWSGKRWRETHTNVWNDYIYLVYYFSRKRWRDTYRCMAWLPLIGLLLV